MPAAMRPLTTNRRRPNGRAALGALLVAISVLLLFGLANGRGANPLEHYVVARHPLAVGTRIRAGDLTTAAIHVPSGALRNRIFLRPAALVGAVAVASVGAGELVQASAVIAAGAGWGAILRQVSVPIETGRALGSRLQPGEAVDVLATYGTGADAFTATVVRSAVLVARDAPIGSLGDRRTEVLVLGVRTAADATALAHAVAVGQLSVVRTSGVATGDAPGIEVDGPYRPDRPGTSR